VDSSSSVEKFGAKKQENSTSCLQLNFNVKGKSY